MIRGESERSLTLTMTMRGILVLLSLTVLMTSLVAGSWMREESVLRFTIEEEKSEQKEMTVAEEDAYLFKKLMSSNGEFGTRRLSTYKFKDCGDPTKEQISISKLVFSPDPLSFPGTLYVDFEGEFKETLDTPLTASVVLERRVGSTWIKIPCLGQIGSCTYDDVCDLLHGAVCPPAFLKNNVPCKCPFVKGTYSLPNAAFDVTSAVFPSGDYYASANLTSSGTFIGCVELWASFD